MSNLVINSFKACCYGLFQVLRENPKEAACLTIISAALIAFERKTGLFRACYRCLTSRNVSVVEKRPLNEGEKFFQQAMQKGHQTEVEEAQKRKAKEEEINLLQENLFDRCLEGVKDDEDEELEYSEEIAEMQKKAGDEVLICEAKKRFKKNLIEKGSKFAEYV